MKRKKNQPAPKKTTKRAKRSKTGKRANTKAETEQLRGQLESALETLRAIQNGEVDALVVNGADGERIFTLKNADQPYRILVETMSEGAVTLNSKGVIFFANLAFAKMLQLPLESLVGTPIEQLICDPEKELFKNAFTQARAGKTTRCVLRCKSARGVLIHVQISMSQVELEDSSGVCLIATDLSEQKRLEEVRADVERLNLERELRESFVATLSHDLRNPLTAAKTNAQLIMRYSCAMEKHTALGNRIVHSIERADAMIQNLLDASRIGAGKKIPLQISKCDLVETTKTTLEELSIVAGDRFELQDAQPIFGYWSRDQLRRVIENLATNAVKYGSPQSPVKVKIKEAYDQVLISVHNEGPGLSREEQENLFKPFTRTQSAQTSGQLGWGLGLTLVRGVAEAHGGHVEVKSTTKDGTTFTVVLPRDARPFYESLDQ